MAQEQHNLGCTYSGGRGGSASGAAAAAGGSSGALSCSRSKKMKQKKVPQRGLGVAQLEKIRIEEQHKKESFQSFQQANILAKNGADSNSFLAVQKFRQGVSISPFHTSVPLPPPLPSDINPPYRHAQSLPPNLEIMQENYVQIVSKQSNDGGVELDNQGNLPRLWGGEIREKMIRLDHNGFPFDPQETPSSVVLPYHIVSQRSQQFHHPPPPPSMLNSSPGILPSSVVNSQMEPPSNQSFRGSSYATFLTEEDEVVGMKRAYPFSYDSPSAPSSHRSFRPIYSASSSKLDDLALRNNGYTDQMESRNKSIRIGPSNSSPLPDTIPNEVNNEKITADFLSLAPPSVASPPLITKHVRYSGYQGNEYEQRPSQEYAKVDKTFSFFPTKLQSNGSTGSENAGNDKNGDKIDLNLKL